MLIAPDTFKLAVFAANLTDEEEPFTSAAGVLFKEVLGSAGISPERLAFGWLTDIRSIKGREDTKFVILAGDDALHVFRADLNVRECHGRAMISTENLIIFPLFHPEAYYRNPRWRDLLLEELSVLRQIGSEPESWHSHTPDTCVRCRGEFFRVDEQGVVFCEEHWGQGVRPNRPLTPDEVARFFGASPVPN